MVGGLELDRQRPVHGRSDFLLLVIPLVTTSSLDCGLSGVALK